MADDAKIRLGMDASGAIREAQKVKKATEKAADGAGKIAKNVQKTTKNTKQANKSAKGLGRAFGESLLKVDLIQQAINTAGQTARQIITELSGASQTQRQRRLASFEALTTLGVDRGQEDIIRRLETTQGLADPQQRLGFLQSLGGMREQGRRFTRRDVETLALAFARGGEIAFGKGGQALLKNLQPGVSAEEAVRRTSLQRRAAVTGLASFEARAEAELITRRARTERLRSQMGTSAELGRARYEQRKAESPALGGAATGADTITGGLFGEVVSARMSALPSEINGNTRALLDLRNELRADRNRKRVAAQGENGR